MIKEPQHNQQNVDERIKQIQKFIGRGKRILDLGCSRGEIMQYLKNFQNEVVGLDIDESSIKSCLEKGLEVYHCDIEKDDFPKLGFFDIVLMAEVLEHMIDPLLVLKNKVYHLLRDDGYLIISIPNSAYLKHRLNLFFGRIPDFGEYQGTPEVQRPYNLLHKTNFSKKIIIKTLKMAGFEVKKIEPTRGVISNEILKIPIFKVLRNLFPSVWVGSFTIIAIKK